MPNSPNDQPISRPPPSSFEELGIWQDARLLVKLVYRACKTTQLGEDSALRNQLIRSAISIMANIAEGHGRRGDREFIHFLKIARGSCSETLSHMYIAKDMRMINETTFDDIHAQASKTGKRLSALIRHLRTSLKESPEPYSVDQQPKRQNDQPTKRPTDQ